MLVYVATYTHRHGTDVAAFSTNAKAQAWAAEIASDWWEEELGDVPRPLDPAALADEYFHLVEDEFFDIAECTLDA